MSFNAFAAMLDSFKHDSGKVDDLIATAQALVDMQAEVDGD